MRTIRRWIGLIFLALVAPSQAQLPSRYEVIRQFGKPCRVDTRTLPWRIENSDPRRSGVVTHALKAWNAEGLRLGVGPFFAAPIPGQPIDLVVDWSGQGLPPDKAGGVYWDARLTERDQAALTWLYGVSEWVPILSPRQPFVKAPTPGLASPSSAPESTAPVPVPKFTPVPP